MTSSTSVSGSQTFRTFGVLVVVMVVQGRPDAWKESWPVQSFGINFKPPSTLHFNEEIGGDLIRPKRISEHHITECMHLVYQEGEFYYKEMTHPDGNVCGIYIYGEPDQIAEIQFNYLDVTCENGGLVVVVDGWELNGEVFPNPDDHPRALKSRFNEYCGKRKIRQTFLSSQNVALIQHRMPLKGSSFSFTVKFLKNPTPCNILVKQEETFTLRNYERRSNCSLSATFPAAIRVLSLNVGVKPTRNRGVEFETGTFHKCQKRGVDDFVQIGGSTGLDSGNMRVADSLCGINSKPAKYSEYIACDTSTVRLVSSGAFDNSVTVTFTRLTDNDINTYMSLVCLPDDLQM